MSQDWPATSRKPESPPPLLLGRVFGLLKELNRIEESFHVISEL